MINIEPVNTYIITYSPEIFDSRFSIKNNSDKWLIKVTRNDANINATSYEIKIRDNIKNKFCEDKNIKLIRLNYKNYKKIGYILKKSIKNFTNT